MEIVSFISKFFLGMHIIIGLTILTLYILYINNDKHDK